MDPQASSTTSGALLLENLQSLCIRATESGQVEEGYEPLKRPIDVYIGNGFVNLDKPLNSTAQQSCRFVRSILEVTRTRHAGSFDSRVSGCLIVCINDSTRLVKWQQNADKSYVVLIHMHAPLPNFNKLKEVCRLMQGPIFQREIISSKKSGELQIRNLKYIEPLEYDRSSGLGLIRINCQAGIYVKTLCSHIGLLVGRSGILQEARRIKSGILTEDDNLATLHDLSDAQWLYEKEKDERYLRSAIMPMERLLIGLKRIMVLDSAVAALCYGAQLTVSGILRYSAGINMQDEVVIMTTKGEAIAIGTAANTSVGLEICSHGIAVRLKRVLMNRGVYRKQWLETRARKKARQSRNAYARSYRVPPQFIPFWY